MRAGAPHSFLELTGVSGGAGVVAAVVSYGTQAASRSGWAMTGQVTLSGKINAVGKVRAKVGVRGAQH
jgi:ATP-dependent Lon protease